MEFKKRIEYVHGSYRGFLNNYLATSLLDTKEDVMEELNKLENLFKEYDPVIVKSFFSKDKKLVERFLNNLDDLRFSLDLKKGESGKELFKKSLSFKDYFNNSDKS